MNSRSIARLRAMTPADRPSVRHIYEAGIATGHATFATTAPDWDDWDTAHLTEHRLVATIDGEVIGWTAMSPVSHRCVYAGVAEHSVYVHPAHRGRGVRRRERIGRLNGVWRDTLFLERRSIVV